MRGALANASAGSSACEPVDGFAHHDPDVLTYKGWLGLAREDHQAVNVVERMNAPFLAYPTQSVLGKRCCARSITKIGAYVEPLERCFQERAPSGSTTPGSCGGAVGNDGWA